MWKWIGSIIIILGIFILKCFRLWLKRSWGTWDKAQEEPISQKVIIVTGANSGIGKATALELAQRDAIVVLACRSLIDAYITHRRIRKVTKKGKLDAMKLDLSSIKSIKSFVREFKGKYRKLDILINNAGVFVPVTQRLTTEDGFEIHMGVNHLGHFLLTNLLLESLKRAEVGKVITLSSFQHSKGQLDFDDLMSENKDLANNIFNNPLYCNSKLANALFSKELARMLERSNVRTYCVCPGMVQTNIARHIPVRNWRRWISCLLMYFTFKTPEEGCQTTLYCALSKTIAHQSGGMYQNCSEWPQEDRIVLSDDQVRDLWALSEKLVGI